MVFIQNYSALILCFPFLIYPQLPPKMSCDQSNLLIDIWQNMWHPEHYHQVKVIVIPLLPVCDSLVVLRSPANNIQTTQTPCHFSFLLTQKYTFVQINLEQLITVELTTSQREHLEDNNFIFSSFCWEWEEAVTHSPKRQKTETKCLGWFFFKQASDF